MPRMVVVWCPDWPVAAAGAPPGSLTAVVHANRVVACSEAARTEGVRPGLRRREAQSRCPELELLAHDPARDARAFEPVLAAVEQLTPWVEVLQPGECAFPARGAARYHGGEPALAVTVTAAVHAAITGRGSPPVAPVGRGAPGDHRGGPPASWVGCRVGIADGTFAAGLAARHQAIVPPGGSRAFLAPHPVAAIDRPDLADLLVRLGLRTLGDLAALPSVDLATRFGPEGARAARLAAGLDEHSRGARRPPPDLRVSAELDPPADRVDIAAFTAKTLADELVARLDHLGLACTRLRIEAETDHAETLSRVWRYDPTTPTPHLPSIPDPVPRSPASGAGGSRSRGPADPPARMAAVMAERVRWQLDGWLTGRTGNPPGALTHLTLVPDEVVPNQGRQLGFWGGESALTQRAARALARIQGLLGPEAVQTAHLQGGRDPATRITLTPGTESEAAAGPGSIEPGRAEARGTAVGPGAAHAPGSRGPGQTGDAGSGIREVRSRASNAGDAASESGRITGPGSEPEPGPRVESAGSGAEAMGSGAEAMGSEGGGAGLGGGWIRGARAEVGELPARSDPVPTARSGHAPPLPAAFPLDPPAARALDRPDPPDPPAARGPGPPDPSAPLVRGRAGGLATRGVGRLPGAVPWPGQVPAPAPAIVYAEPVPAEVVDATGATVAVDGRGLLGSFPSRLRVRGRDWSIIIAWAGPWLVDERWWDPAAHRRLVRLQATTDQGAAYLLRLTGGRWWVEAIYD